MRYFDLDGRTITRDQWFQGYAGPRGNYTLMMARVAGFQVEAFSIGCAFDHEDPPKPFGVVIREESRKEGSPAETEYSWHATAGEAMAAFDKLLDSGKAKKGKK